MFLNYFLWGRGEAVLCVCRGRDSSESMCHLCVSGSSVTDDYKTFISVTCELQLGSGNKRHLRKTSATYSVFLFNKDTLRAACKGSLPLHLSGTHSISCYITSPLYCSLLQRRGLIALINNTDIDSREATRFLLKTPATWNQRFSTTAQTDIPNVCEYTQNMIPVVVKRCLLFRK